MTEFQAPLLLDGIAPGERIVVAMSGGVDSSVAAALLHEAGYDVLGITLQLYNYGGMVKKGACCAGKDIFDAKNVAEKCGFAHYVLDYESVFKQHVIDDFADSYLRGETPLPCVRCNQKVKFHDLLHTAKEFNAKALVTGHYVRRVVSDTTLPELHRAYDKIRDQSYFLFTTTQEQLDYLRFPLGDFENKDMTRYHANRLGLNVADKPDSQDICFVPSGGYKSVVEKIRPGALDPGPIVHIDGTVLGEHQGIIGYTIGQRKGLGISYSDPLYVIRLDPIKKQVIVGPKEALAVTTLYLQDVNWLSDPASFETGRHCTIKIRSTAAPLAAQITSHEGNRATVILAEPEYGLAFGQAGVFYDGDRVLGGGWITQNLTI